MRQKKLGIVNRNKMSLRFRGGERLQRGRGIGGILRLLKSLFSPIIKSAGKKIAKAATSSTAKSIGNSVKDQLIESGLKVGVDALRGENLEQSLKNEFKQVKRKAADVIDDHAIKHIKSKKKMVKKQKQHKPKKNPIIKRKGDLFG